MAITPDTKDWTWVLERPCDQCGYDAAPVAPASVAELLRENAARWPAVLARPDARERPDDSTWSPLEYGAHVRDVFRIFRVRLASMRDDDNPLFANWDQDATAIEDRYNEQDPTKVAQELVDAAGLLAADFDTVSGDEWDRLGRRSDGATFTVSTLALYLLHDPVHHLWDVRG
ncbi:MAG: DinB family protein [Glaciihabitans sp.]